jgi:hypothetical protein
METSSIVVVVGTALLLIIAGWIILRQFKKRKKEREIINNPPKELLDKLNEAEALFERRRIETNGKCDPYEILWEISKGDRIGKPSQPIIRTESSVARRQFLQQHNGRQSIPSESSERVKEDIRQPERIEQSRSRNFFSRFRRRTN